MQNLWERLIYGASLRCISGVPIFLLTLPPGHGAQTFGVISQVEGDGGCPEFRWKRAERRLVNLMCSSSCSDMPSIMMHFMNLCPNM